MRFVEVRPAVEVREAIGRGEVAAHLPFPRVHAAWHAAPAGDWAARGGALRGHRLARGSGGRRRLLCSTALRLLRLCGGFQGDGLLGHGGLLLTTVPDKCGPSMKDRKSTRLNSSH